MSDGSIYAVSISIVICYFNVVNRTLIAYAIMDASLVNATRGASLVTPMGDDSQQ